MESTNEKLKVFLCHASENQPIVKAVFDRLVQAGYEPWMDTQILPGMKWALEIKKALHASDAVIICLSKNSIHKKGRLQRELKLAQDIEKEQPENSIYLIPLLLDDCEIPVSLSDIQWADYNSADGFDRVLRSLNARAQELGRGTGHATQTSAAASEEQPGTPQPLDDIKALVEAIKLEIPADRFFEFGDNPRIIERVETHLQGFLRALEAVRSQYTSGTLGDSNPYFDVIKVAHKFQDALKDIRRKGGGSQANTAQVRAMIQELDTSLAKLSPGNY